MADSAAGTSAIRALRQQRLLYFFNELAAQDTRYPYGRAEAPHRPQLRRTAD